MNDWITVVSGPLGALATLALFLYGFRAGWWSTSLEVQAWRERALRAEGQVDTILPALERVGGMVTMTAESQKDISRAQIENARAQAVLLSFMEELREGRATTHPKKGPPAS